MERGWVWEGESGPPGLRFLDVLGLIPAVLVSVWRSAASGLNVLLFDSNCQVVATFYYVSWWLPVTVKSNQMKSY